MTTRSVVIPDADMHFEISPTQYALRIYGGDGDNYVAGATIRTYGDRGWMSQIIGAKFYVTLRDHLHDILEACACKTLEGYMTDAHARLLKRMCRGRAEFKISHRGLCAGREMPWVAIGEFEPVGMDAGVPSMPETDD